jgi:uncharacterized protein (TIGR02284 family)
MQTIIPPVSLGDPRDETAGIGNAKALIALYDRTVDSAKGYAKMVEKAEPSFRDTAERFRAVHARHADDLARLLADLNITAEGDGSIMGLVNQAVVTFRAFFDDIDEDVMDQVHSGEDWVLKAFDAAIAEQSAATTTAKLREMRAELTDILAETQRLG